MTTRAAAEKSRTIDFVFVGGSLALDLVNTEVIVRGKPHDLLATPDDVVDWRRRAGERYQDADIVHFNGSVPAADTEFLAATKALRATLRRIFSAIDERRDIKSADLDQLNVTLKLGVPAVARDTNTAVRAVYRTTNDLHGVGLLPVALSAMRLLTEGNLSRVHHCRNRRCILFFYDETRSGTRHWCSPGCMNRARSSQRYHAKKQGEAA